MMPEIFQIQAQQKNTALERNFITEYIEGMFERADREENLPVGMRYDGYFLSFADPLLRNIPISQDQKDDLVIEALALTFEVDKIQAFKPKEDLLKSFNNYFITIFLSRLKNEIRNQSKRWHDRLEFDNEEGEGSEERRDIKHSPDTDTRKLLQHEDFIAEFSKYLKNSNNPELSSIFEFLLEGYKGKDIAEELKVTPGTIVNRIKEIGKRLEKFAVANNYNELVRLIEQMNLSSAEEECTTLVKSMLTVAEQYKKKTTKIRVQKIGQDPTDEDTLFTYSTDYNKSLSELERNIQEFHNSVDDSEDLLELDDGLLIGMKQVAKDHTQNYNDKLNNTYIKELKIRAKTYAKLKETPQSESALLERFKKNGNQISTPQLKIALRQLQRTHKIESIGSKWRVRKSIQN